MTTAGIYTITNLHNGKVYIGSAVNIDKRWSEHLNYLQRKNHVNRHLQRAWNKYGENLFKFEVLSSCRKEFLIKREQQAIDDFIQRHGREMLYNLSLVAGSNLGMKHTKETKRKISVARVGNQDFKGRKHSPETKRKISDAKVGCKGHKRSEETKAKISKFREGQKHTDETRVKISEGLKGNRNCKGRKLSLEHRAKISKSLKGRKQSPEHIANKLAALKQRA